MKKKYTKPRLLWHNLLKNITFSEEVRIKWGDGTTETHPNRQAFEKSLGGGKAIDDIYKTGK